MHLIIGFYTACIGLLLSDNPTFANFVRGMYDDKLNLDKKAELYFKCFLDIFSRQDQITISSVLDYSRFTLGRELDFNDYNGIVEEVLTRYPMKEMDIIQQDCISIIQHIYYKAKVERGFKTTLSDAQYMQLSKGLTANQKDAVNAIVGHYGTNNVSFKNTIAFILSVQERTRSLPAKTA